MQIPVSAPCPCAATAPPGGPVGMTQVVSGQGAGGVFVLTMAEPGAGIADGGLFPVVPDSKPGKPNGNAPVSGGLPAFPKVGPLVGAVWHVAPPVEAVTISGPLVDTIAPAAEPIAVQGAAEMPVGETDARPDEPAGSMDQPAESDAEVAPSSVSLVEQRPNVNIEPDVGPMKPAHTTAESARADMPADLIRGHRSNPVDARAVASLGPVVTNPAAPSPGHKNESAWDQPRTLVPGTSIEPSRDVFIPVRGTAGRHAEGAAPVIASGVMTAPGQTHAGRAPENWTPDLPEQVQTGGKEKAEARLPEAGVNGASVRSADGGPDRAPVAPTLAGSTMGAAGLPLAALHSRPGPGADQANFSDKQAAVNEPAPRNASIPATMTPGEHPQPPITARETTLRPDVPPVEKPLQQAPPTAAATPREGTPAYVPAPTLAVGSATPAAPTVSPLPGAPALPETTAQAPTPDVPGRDHGSVSSPPAAPLTPVPAGAARPVEAVSQPSPAVEPDLADGIPPNSAEASPRAAVGRGDISPATAPDLARGVAVQIAQTVTQGGTRSVDVMLQPEELGRVRISMSSEHGALAVTLQADRPETLDLIRRHIDLFAGELRRLGHGSVGFSFQHGSPGGGGAQPGPAPAPPGGEPSTLHADIAAEAAMKPAPVPLAPRAGIDIRI